MKLRKVGFQQRLISLLVVTMLMTFLIVAVSTQFSTRNNIINNSIRMQNEALEIKTSLFDVYLQRIQQLSNNLYSNADVYKQIQIEEPDSTNSYRIFLFLKSLRSMSPGTDLYQIYLDNYSSGLGYLVSEKASSYGTSRYHIKMPYTITRDKVLGEGPLLSSSYGFSIRTSGRSIYSFHKRLYDYAHIKPLATISFDVEVTALRNYLFGEENDADSIFYLIQDPGEIIFTNGFPLTQQQINTIMENCESNGWSDIKLNDFSGIAFVGDAQLEDLNFHLVQMISYDDIFSEANQVFTNNILLMIFAFLFSCLLITSLVHQVSQPLHDLDSYVTAMEKQGLHPDAPCRLEDYVHYNKDDEIGHLAIHTEQSFLALQEMFSRQENLNQAYRTAEAKMLQAQINPHFLYNSLQSIASVALQHGDKETFRYITQLGGMMQYSMNLQQNTVPLQKEFEHVKTYIALQNVRFAHELHYEAELQPEAADILVPKMILQPLAGNAYKHGNVCRKENSYFYLSAQIHDNNLIIITENNGDSCPEEKINQLNLALMNPTSSELSGDSGIGLKNVLHRLRIYFGEETQMRLTTNSEGGVRITLTIPLTDARIDSQ